MSFFGGLQDWEKALGHGGAAVVVNRISNTVLGRVGGALALLGVVACPITSGDTAFRSARLTIADAIGYKQGPVANRFYSCYSFIYCWYFIMFYRFQYFVEIF